MGGLREEGYEKIREGWKMERGGRRLKTMERKNTLPDPHTCTAGNKEEEHIIKLSSEVYKAIIHPSF